MARIPLAKQIQAQESHYEQSQPVTRYTTEENQSPRAQGPIIMKDQENGKMLKYANKKVIEKLLRNRLNFKRMHEHVQISDWKPQGTFFFHGQRFDYDVRALFIFKSDSIIRQRVVWLIEWRYFELYIVLTIIVNSISLALYDQFDRISETPYNQILDQIQNGFTIVFTIEAILRIIGMGFIIHQKSYLRNLWNWLDLFTIIVGWLEFIPGLPNLKFFRALRILRPLRTLHAIPGLKRLISSLLKSLRLLANVVTFLLFFAIFFGIIGVGIFKGQQYNRCHLTQIPSLDTYLWQVDPTQTRLCSLPDSALVGYRCLAGTYCGQPSQFDLPVTSEYITSNIQYGMSSFDNLLYSISTIFQVITLEGWITIMYNMQDTGLSYQSPIYLILIVVFGSFFLMNLILAAIMDSFEKVDKETAIEDLKKEFRDVELRAQKSMRVVDRKQKISQIDQDEDVIFVKSSINQINEEPIQYKINSSIYTEQDEQLQIRSDKPDNQQQQSMFQEPQQIYQSNTLNNQNELEAYKISGNLELSKNNEIINQQIGSEKNQIQHKPSLAKRIADNQYFSAAIFLVIMINTIVLLLDRYPITQSEVSMMNLINTVFYGVFVFEMIIKILVYGPTNYVRDRFNIFDIIVILLSTADIVITAYDTQGVGRTLIVFRALRFLRIFKIARQWKSLQVTLMKMQKSLTEMLYFLVLLFLFIFVYAMLGMELYANQIKFTNENDEPVPCNIQNLKYCASQGSSPRVNFDNFQNALVAVFIIIVGDDWNLMMSTYVRATSMWSVVYFISLTIFGNIIMLNLFLAILLRQFNDKSLEENFEKTEYKHLYDQVVMHSTTVTVTFWGWVFIVIQNVCCCFKKKQNSQVLQNSQNIPSTPDIIVQEQNNQILKDEEAISKEIFNQNNQENQINKEIETIEVGAQNGNSQEAFQSNNVSKNIKPIQNNQSVAKLIKYGTLANNEVQHKNSTILEGKSLFLFSQNNWFRIICNCFVENSYSRAFFLISVILSTINLAQQQPLSNPKSEFNKIIYFIDLGFSLLFAFEIILKILAKGFYWNGKSSYLRNNWSAFDFAVIVLSLISFVSVTDIKITKILRNFRVVRPLRLIVKNQGLRLALHSLVNSIKGLINVTIIALFMFFIWGIFGVCFFKGYFYECFTSHTVGSKVFTLFEQDETKWDCIDSGGEWIEMQNSFDNVFYAAFLLYQVSTTEGWVDQMFRALDATQIDYMPKVRNSTSVVSAFFICFIFIGGLFTLNLFQGVVISTYLDAKDKLTNNHLLTEMQREWLQVQIRCYESVPKIRNAKAQSALRKALISFTTSHKFDVFIYIIIILNTIVLACNWYGRPKEVEIILNYINIAFTAIFLIEALLKILANGILYFKKYWNIFDFLILGLTIYQTREFLWNNNLTMYATILRSLKLLKTAVLFKNAQNFRNIAKTLLTTIPSLANIAFLLFLLIVFYAIMGMSVFGRVLLHDALDNQANFQTFDKAFLTMMRCATGEAWNEIMTSLMDQRSITYQCIDSPSYEDIVRNNGQGIACGSYWPSLVFFLSYQMLVCQIFLNLFIAIILDGFDDTKQELQIRISPHMIKIFKQNWADFDPEGSGFIPSNSIEDFISELIVNKTGWVRGGEILLMNQNQLRKFISFLELPFYNGLKHFYYYDVLSKLCQTVFKVDFEKFVMEHNQTTQIAEAQLQKAKSVKIPVQEKVNIERGQNSKSQKQQENQWNDNSTNLEQVKIMRTNKKLEDFTKLDVIDTEEKMLKWMESRDHLIFESFDDFYYDLLSKVNGPIGYKIALNAELIQLKVRKEAGLHKIINFYDSRVMTLIPKVISQMKKLTLSMKARRVMRGSESMQLEIHNELKAIRARGQPSEYITKKNQDFLQILAKHLQDENRLQQDRQIKREQSTNSRLSRKDLTLNISSKKIPHIFDPQAKRREGDLHVSQSLDPTNMHQSNLQQSLYVKKASQNLIEQPVRINITPDLLDELNELGGSNEETPQLKQEW